MAAQASLKAAQVKQLQSSSMSHSAPLLGHMQARAGHSQAAGLPADFRNPTCAKGQCPALGVHSRPKVAPPCTRDLDDLVRPRHALRRGVALRAATLCSPALSAKHLGQGHHAQPLAGQQAQLESALWCDARAT